MRDEQINVIASNRSPYHACISSDCFASLPLDQTGMIIFVCVPQNSTIQSIMDETWKFSFT